MHVSGSQLNRSSVPVRRDLYRGDVVPGVDPGPKLTHLDAFVGEPGTASRAAPNPTATSTRMAATPNRNRIVAGGVSSRFIATIATSGNGVRYASHPSGWSAKRQAVRSIAVVSLSTGHRSAKVVVSNPQNGDSSTPTAAVAARQVQVRLSDSPTDG